MDKQARLLELAHTRQRARWQGYNCIGDYHGGAYECDFVSPYTKAAHNEDATVMVLLQDWSCDDQLSGPLDVDAQELGYTPKERANINLPNLLRRHLGLSLADVFGTNVFPFVKLGPMNAQIPMPDLIRAAREYALPQIEIVAARLAICLGAATYNAVRRAVGLRSVNTVAEAVASPFPIGGTQV